MNKEAVALAADSAVTMQFESGPKVFPSANKIFALSKYEPIAVMIYGNAGLMGVPWEPAIKLFREQLGDKTYPSVQKYAATLLAFLRDHRQLFPPHQAETFYRQHLLAYFNLVRDAAKPTQPDVPPTAPDAEKAVIEHLALLKKAKFLPSAGAKDVDAVKAGYGKLIAEVYSLAFDGVTLTKAARRALQQIGVLCLLKCPEQITWPSASGVVVAGFGSKEFFPALRSFSVQGIFAGHLHYRAEREIGIGFDNQAAIVPFAQRDMVRAFMEGVDPAYQWRIEQDMLRLLGEFPNTVVDGCGFLDDAQKAKLKSVFAGVTKKVHDGYRQQLRRYRADNFSNPIVRLVSMLPKSDLATLAESMVSLTSMRRKISGEVETVGGPIDVAIISKGDGLIWVKRKHYFDPALNHQFFHNYYNRGQRS